MHKLQNSKLTLLVSTIAFIRGLAGANCADLGLIPLGGESIAEFDVGVCGYTALIVKQNEPSIEDLGLDTTWFNVHQPSLLFRPVSLPIGDTISMCPQVSMNEARAQLWPSNSEIYLRREFELEAALVDILEDIVVRYIVDNQIIKTYLNGIEFGTAYPFRGGCVGVTRVDHFPIPVSHLRGGKNVLAIHAYDAGGMAYLDLGLSFTVCAKEMLHSCSRSRGPVMGGPRNQLQRCRVRCDVNDFCKMKDAVECGPSYIAEITGDCLCTMTESLMCSGEILDEDTDVCYPSRWILGHVSRLKGCSPAIETDCAAVDQF